MARSQTDYGLPALTFEEAAKVLGVDKGALMSWIMERLAPSPTQWSFWKNGERALPEAVIRLYLMHRGAAESAYHRELREIKAMVSKVQEEEAKISEALRRREQPRKRRAG